jgi:hypothetical protein
MIYGCLNSFYLEPGEYDITLEFVTSPLRKAGNIISGISLLILCCSAVFPLIRARWSKKPGSPIAADLPSSDA